MQTKIVEAVGLARRSGHQTIASDVRIVSMRALAWIMFRKWIPLNLRQWALFVIPREIRRWASPFSGAASKGNTYENDLLLLLFNATTIANVAINATSSPLTNLAVALHTADPGETGDQTTNEITYTSYARVSVARTSGGWTVTNNSVSPVAAITFPAGTNTSGTATHFSIGATGGGATKIFYYGTVTPNIACGNGITPSLTTATAITED